MINRVINLTSYLEDLIAQKTELLKAVELKGYSMNDKRPGSELSIGDTLSALENDISMVKNFITE